jgi:hypothetical protein
MDVKKAAVIGTLAIVALGVAGYLFLRHSAEPETPPPAPVPAPPAKPADAPLPPPAVSDTRLRADFSSVSPKLGPWLEQHDLLDRAASSVDAVARDESPRKQLDFLAPKSRFTSSKGHVDPKSFTRYDGVADVITSMDSAKLVAAIRTAHPLLESAYHRIADPNRSFEDALRAALQRIADAPVVEGEFAVTPHGAVDLFADEKLEVLGPVEKHLLRMGPRNQKLIQAKAREVLAALRQ